jgi:hypothetical protein
VVSDSEKVSLARRNGQLVQTPDVVKGGSFPEQLSRPRIVQLDAFIDAGDCPTVRADAEFFVEINVDAPAPFR